MRAHDDVEVMAKLSIEKHWRPYLGLMAKRREFQTLFKTRKNRQNATVETVVYQNVRFRD